MLRRQIACPTYPDAAWSIPEPVRTEPPAIAHMLSKVTGDRKRPPGQSVWPETVRPGTDIASLVSSEPPSASTASS